MMKKKGKSRTGMTGTEQAALAARQAGLLDAYTESSNSNLSESDKFKEGYVKKGKKAEKKRKSESEDVQPAKEEIKEPDNWDDEGETVESWEDIEAPDMPVPTKVKQEMRKQEKQRKKEEERRSKDVDQVTSGLDKVSLAEQPSSDNVENKDAKEKQQMNSKSSKTEKESAEPASANTVKENSTAGQQKKTGPPEEKADPAAVKADREAKKAAKAAAKAAAKQKHNQTAAAKADGESEKATAPDAAAVQTDVKDAATAADDKAAEQKRKAEEKAKRKAEFEAKKKAEESSKEGEAPAAAGGTEKSKAELKAERRAKQEAQRAAKAQAQEQKKQSVQKVRVPDEIQADQVKVEKKLAKVLASHNLPARTKAQKLVPLFSHLHQYEKNTSLTKDLPVVGGSIHPSFLRIGLEFTEGNLDGSEERCQSLLRALEDVILDCLSSIKDIENCDLFKEFDNSLKPNLTFLKECRPLSISMSNAVRVIKGKLKMIDRCVDMESLTEEVRRVFSDFIRENFQLAADQISLTAGKKIQNGDVILTYSDSMLVERLLLDAAKEKKFRVIVADGRLHNRGKQLAEKLVKEGVDTTYILVTAITQVLPAVTKVFLGCEGVMANGGVLAEVGTSQVALMADSMDIPVLLCCQTYKFTERVQTDSFVNNELMDPEDLVQTDGQHKYLDNWREQNSLYLLNLVYDVTPASLVRAVITELSVIPTTSVPVILRLKNSDGHLNS